MATLSTNTPKTSWAFKAHAFLMEQASPEAVLGGDAFIFTADAAKLAAGTYDLGIIDEDGFSISTDDGDTLELKDINGVLIDRLVKEGTINVSFTLVKPSESTRGKFWTIQSAGDDDTADHLRVSSILTAKHYALAFGNVGEDAAGTEAVVFPYCSITAKPVYAADKGWTMECTAYVLKGGAADDSDKFLFDFVTLTEALLGLSASE